MTDEDLAHKIRSTLRLGEDSDAVVLRLVQDIRREIELDVAEEVDDLRDDLEVSRQAEVQLQSRENHFRSLVGHDKAWRQGVIGRNRKEDGNPFNSSDGRHAKWTEGWTYLDGVLRQHDVKLRELQVSVGSYYAVVTRISQQDPWTPGGPCFYCGSPPKTEHHRGCTWIRATQAVEQLPTRKGRRHGS